MNVLCKLLLWSCLCCTLAVRVQAQQDGNHAARQHPAQDQLLHEKFYAKWHMPDNPSVSCCNEADCYPTEIKYVDGDIYARRREDGKYIPVPPEKVERNRDNPDTGSIPSLAAASQRAIGPSAPAAAAASGRTAPRR